MKSRKKFTVSNVDKSNLLDAPKTRSRKIISNNPLLQKNLAFLEQYNELFRHKPKTFPYGGDATDALFRKSLRNHNEFDLIKELKRHKFIKSVQSDILKKERSSRRIPQVEAKMDPGQEAKPEDEAERLAAVEAEILEAEGREMEGGDVTEGGEEEESPGLEEEEEEGEEEYIGYPEADGADIDEELEAVDKIIEDAEKELESVGADLAETISEKDAKRAKAPSITKAPPTSTGESVFKFNAAIDAQVLRELEDAERQAKETAKTIYELKSRVAELLKTEKMTESEAKELEQKNKQLKAQMLLFEEKTKRIQFLIGQANLFENMVPPKPLLQQKHEEDKLPKVIVCGLSANYPVPKIVVCDDLRPTKKDPCDCDDAPGQGQPRPVRVAGKKPGTADMMPEPGLPQFARKLNECICMQEKMAAENAHLEGMRYQLQSDLFNKDQTVESLQRQLTSLQSQMRMVCQENNMLSTKLQQGGSRPGSPRTPSPCSQPTSGRSTPCGKGKGKGKCPAADMSNKLDEYSELAQELERQLCGMECEVKNMHQELVAVQRERAHLEHHRKMMKPPCAPPCAPPHVCAPACPAPDQRLREMREQYNRLQDDFKGKLIEVAGLRADNERLKKIANECEDIKKQMDDRIKELEKMLKNRDDSKGDNTISKEQFIELEQQLSVAKQRFREAQDELDELRALIQDQQDQLDDYRNKYLDAEQTVEEQRRQIEMMDMENSRINDQVNLEIQRVKNQFQEKLQELTPLPEILKNTQLKLQEAQQMHLLAERNNEAIAKELMMYKDKVAELLGEMDKTADGQNQGESEKAAMMHRLEVCEIRVRELEDEKNTLQDDYERIQAISGEFERQVQEKLHEIAQLASQLENVREESARQVARTKDRCETVRRGMQNQINELERQLAQSRAFAKAAQKDRDDIRQKMQAQITNLNENFEDAQMRIRNLQGHVNFLRSSGGSYPGSKDLQRAPTPDVPDAPCTCGSDF